MSNTLYSLGHSTHSIERLVELCRGAGIDLVCDIRRFPQSRRNPHLGRESLERALPERGIGYRWLGAELGGFREGGYEKWMRAPEFAKGIDLLERSARERTVAFMCSEGLPSRCHRRFVADALASRGHDVDHLLPDGRIVSVQPPLEPGDR